MTMIDMRDSRAFARTVSRPKAKTAPANFATRADAVAEIAARHADEVDALSRFPAEAIDAARDHGLLGMMVPVKLGGEGATLGEVSGRAAIGWAGPAPRPA